MDKKILTAYFTWSGNTKALAEKIHAQIGGDLFEIELETPYYGDYKEVAYGIAKEQKEKGICPPLKNHIDVSNYDVIFTGTPAWWYTMAPPVMTFLAENSFKDKIIVPFITHGGGGKYKIAEDMAKIAAGAKVLEPFVVFDKGDSKTIKEVTAWINSLEI